MKVVKTDGTVTHVPGDHLLTFAQCQKAVGGFVTPLSLGRPLVHTMLLNEDGDPLGLPFNPAASQLAGQRLVGDVVVLETQADYDIVFAEPEPDETTEIRLADGEFDDDGFDEFDDEDDYYEDYEEDQEED